jgi:hypothetical protein
MDDRDKAIETAAAAAENAKDSIKFFRSHVLSDLSSWPEIPENESSGSVVLYDEKDLRSMTHEQLVAHALNLTRHTLFQTRMMAIADAHRVAHGIQDGKWVLEVAETALALGAHVTKARADRQKGVKVKLANDPKQAAKADAFRMWQEWQAGRALYKSGAAFARHVVDSLPLESTDTVERWVRVWRKAANRTD